MRASLWALAGAVCFAAISQVSKADTLLFNGPASSQTVYAGSQSVSPENVYVYPYNFSVNGSSTNTQLMCISFDNEITTGESWNVNVETIAQAAGGNAVVQTGLEMDAWLYSQITSTSTQQQITDVQMAAWAVSDPTVANSKYDPFYTGANEIAINNLLSEAYNNAKPADLSNYNNYVVYVPTSWNSADGEPQTFIGDPPPAATPEPGSLALLGTGLLGMGGFVRRRMQKA
jgi:hypothetical protein